MDPRLAMRLSLTSAPSQRSRESGQLEHLSDLFRNNGPFCIDKTFSKQLQHENTNLIWYEQTVMLEEDEENIRESIEMSASLESNAKSCQAEIIA